MMLFLHRHRLAIFLSYIAGACALGIFLGIETTPETGFPFIVKPIWLPLALIAIAYGWWHQTHLKKSPKFLVKALIIYVFLVCISAPYVLAINALSHRERKVTYRGPLQDKWESFNNRHRSIAGRIIILDQATQQLVPLDCTPDRYAKLNKGDIVTEAYLIGLLGLPYRWKYSPPLSPE